MNKHLSKLVLDELAAGLRTDAAALAHSRDCEECRERLARLTQERTQLQRSAQFEQVFAKLKAKQTLAGAAEAPSPARAKWPRWGFVFGPALAVAAALLVFVLQAPAPVAHTRLKGSASVRVLRAPEGTEVSTARPGDRVVLAVTKAAQSYVLVMAVEASGEVTQAWPSGGQVSGRLPEGAQARLEPGFEVTPGSLALHAFFSAEPLKVEIARAQLERELAEARKAGKSPLEAKLLPIAGDGVVRAVATLEVK